MMYSYITENNLINKQKYNYSEYRGVEFLSEYKESRLGAIGSLSTKNGEEKSMNIIKNGGGVLSCLVSILENKDKTIFDMYVKSFEVRKRLYTEYDENMKPIEISEATFSDFDVYIAFAKCLLMFHRQYKVLKYFNCLLKLDDTMISIKDRMTDRQKYELRNILEQELACYEQIATEVFTKGK